MENHIAEEAYHTFLANTMVDPETEENVHEQFRLMEAAEKERREKWEEELLKRKKEYNASGRRIDFNKARSVEEEIKPVRTYYRGLLDFAEYSSNFGVDIEEEIVCQKELHLIVNDMKVKLVDETKILEGTLNPEYGKDDWRLPHIEVKNELPNTSLMEQQWKNDLQNGCLTTDPTHISTIESNNSACFAGLFNQRYPITEPDARCISLSTNSCSGKSDDCGIETDVTNECSECTVPMINEQMDGMPNEMK